MSTRAFALIIGIDNYKSGSIWNLHSCADDARLIHSWLANDLNIPEDQICMLLDSQATKQNIEDRFTSHLTNNRSIEKGDAIIIYFAGHGSIVPAPEGWYQSDAAKQNGYVEVLCTHDYETKADYGRIAGISDRSMRAMLSELSQAKGDNITLILDSCFSPGREIEGRGHTRWTPTTKVKPDDLYRCLWYGARGRPCEVPHGFLVSQKSYICLAACGSGSQAVEGKNGGRLTHHLLELVSELSLHRISYINFLDRLQQRMPSAQQPVCHGFHRNRILFDGIPFTTDAHFLHVTSSDDKSDRVRIEAGLIHGLVEGSELSLHLHNYRCSKNPFLSTVVVENLHSTWCIARPLNSKASLPKSCWARITRWNNRRPFRVNLKATLTSFIRMWKFRRTFNVEGSSTSRAGLNIMRVRKAAQADISLTLGRHTVRVERHDDIIATNHRRVVKIEKRTGDEVLADAARFHLHLHRSNPQAPFKDLVSMELYRLHSEHWTTMGGNLLHNGKAIIPYEQGAIFSISLYNKSDVDLWPYLAYMDPNCYGITMLYQPDPTASSPPLPKKGYLEIGSGKPGSEALSFTLPDHEHLDSGFLKLFLSPNSIAMAMIEQGPSLAWTTSVEMESVPASPIDSEKGNKMWDASLASVVFLRQHNG
ncbi:Metacaspase-7 [Leucoagaricus sp. SymC.cos]|nr:Metacaspase-7 [Leucoagaricus sp. SymC.cos]